MPETALMARHVPAYRSQLRAARVGRFTSPRTAPPPHQHIALVILAVVVAPIALTHHSAGSLETAYGSAVVSLVTRIDGGDVGANPIPTTTTPWLPA